MILLQNGQTRQGNSFDGRNMAGGLGLGVGGREKGNATNRTLLSWFYILMPSHILPIRQAQISTTLGLLWNNFKTALRKLRGNFETTLRQLWDNFETTLRQFWDNFGTTWRLSWLFWAYTYFTSCGGAPTIQQYLLACLLEMRFLFSTLRSPEFGLAYSLFGISMKTSLGCRLSPWGTPAP